MNCILIKSSYSEEKIQQKCITCNDVPLYMIGLILLEMVLNDI